MKIIYIDLDTLQFNSRVKKLLKSSAINDIDTLFIGCSNRKGYNYSQFGRVNELYLPIDPPLPIKLIIFWIYIILSVSKEIFINGKPDYIVSCDIFPMFPTFLLKTIFRVKIVYDAHEYWRGHSAFSKDSFKYKFWNFYQDRLITQFEKISTVGNVIAKDLKKDHNLKDLPIVLPNIPNLNRPKSSNYLREKYKILDDQFIFIYQGSLYHGDSYDKIFRSIERIEDCVMVVVTHKADRVDEFKARYSSILDKKLFFHKGVTPDKLLEITSSADCGMMILDNLGESFYNSVPNKMFEYLRSGIPQITSNFPEMNHYIVDLNVGVSVDPDDESGIYSTMKSMIEDKKLYEALKNKALANRDTYHWDNYFKLFLESIR